MKVPSKQFIIFLMMQCCILLMSLLKILNVLSKEFVFFLMMQFCILYVLSTLFFQFIGCFILSIGYMFFVFYRNNLLQKCLEFWKIDDKINIPCKPIGLENKANNCYMNSLIQMLASSNKIIHQFEYLKSNISAPNPALTTLIDLLHGVNNPNSSSKENTEKLDSLIDNIKWEKVSQQDVFDLLSSIINEINEKIQTDLSTKMIPIVLKHEMLYQYSGIDIRNKVQYHLGLSLGLFGNYKDQPGVTIEDLIKNHLSSCFIDEDENKKSRVLFYKKTPDVLLLHIQANKWSLETGKMIKPIYHIKYKQDLQLTLDIAVEYDKIIKNQRVNYVLSAIVHHMGTITEGHYIVYRKYQNRWYLVNDEDVREVEFKYNVCPYILIYEKDATEKICLH